MDLNELLKDVTSFSKEAAMKENMRMLSLKDSVTAEAFKHAQLKLASYFGNIKIDSPESNLTEFSRNSLSGNMKAVLSVSTTAGLKRLPIHFTVKASVPTLVETPEQIVASLENVKGSIDEEVEKILEAQNKKLQTSEEEVEIDNKIQSALDNGMETKAAYDELMFGIKKEAKKKEVELVSVENTSASQFPVKVLKYPKMYLPELKKGDIINVGGLKYKYTGDDKTISGEPGLNVYLELVCNTKTASLNKVAEDEDNDKAKETAEAMKEATQARNYIENQLNDIENLSNKDIQYLVLLAEDYLKDSKKESQKTTYNYLLNTVAEDKELSMWYLTRDGSSLEDISNVKSNILENVKDLRDVKSIIKAHSEDIDNLKDFNGLPKFIKDIIGDETTYLAELIEEHPNLINDELADKIIKEDPETAIDLGMNHPDVDRFKKFKEFADNEVKQTSESLEKEVEPSDKELSDIQNEDSKKEETEEVETKKSFDSEEAMIEDIKKEWHPEWLSTTLKQLENGIAEEYGVTVDDALFEKVTGHTKEEYDTLQKEKAEKVKHDQPYDLKERNFTQKNPDKAEDSKELIDETMLSNDESLDDPTAKKESPIEKEAELDTLSFKANVSELDIEWLDGRDENIKNKLKEIDTRLANIPNEWIEIKDTTWYGDIKWSASIDVKEWGLSSISFDGEPSQVECDVTVYYFENAEAADSGDYSDLIINVKLDLQKVDVEFDGAQSSNYYNDIFAKSLNIYEDNTAILFL